MCAKNAYKDSTLCLDPIGNATKSKVGFAILSKVQALSASPQRSLNLHFDHFFSWHHLY